jgi:RNA polymerase sigma factor FliA
LIEEYLGFARAIAAKIFQKVGAHVSFDELLSLANTGLLQAADRYDESSGVAFTTFAHYRIRGAIYDGVRQLAHLPRSEYRKLQARERADGYLAAAAAAEAAARTPGAAPDLRSTEDDLRAVFERMAGVTTTLVVSLDAGDGSQPAEQFDQDGPSPEVAVSNHQLAVRLRTAIRELPERERHLIEKHYYEDKPLAEAGRELGLSKSWSSRLHARAIDQLRRLLER